MSHLSPGMTTMPGTVPIHALLVPCPAQDSPYPCPACPQPCPPCPVHSQSCPPWLIASPLRLPPSLARASLAPFAPCRGEGALGEVVRRDAGQGVQGVPCCACHRAPQCPPWLPWGGGRPGASQGALGWSSLPSHITNNLNNQTLVFAEDRGVRGVTGEGHMGHLGLSWELPPHLAMSRSAPAPTEPPVPAGGSSGSGRSCRTPAAWHRRTCCTPGWPKCPSCGQFPFHHA